MSHPNDNTLSRMLPVAQTLIAGDRVNSVSARDLHSALEVETRFDDWIKYQLGRARLRKDRDFEVFLKIEENPQGGRPRTEYALTLDAAKHIAMLSGSDRGFEVREYFLECERRANDPLHRLMSMTRAETLEMAAQLAREKEELKARADAQQATIAALEPKAQALDAISGASGTTCILGAAKALKVKSKDLTAFMVKAGWVYRREGPRGSGELMAFQSKIDAGLLSHRFIPITHRDGSLGSKNQVLVTAKGLTKLAIGLGVAS